MKRSIKVIFLTKSYSEFPWTQSKSGMSNKYRVLEKNNKQMSFFPPVIKEEQSWFTF